MRSKVILSISIPLIILLIGVSLAGLSSAQLYASETLNWQAQSLGQDMIDLCFVAPCLILTTILVCKNSKFATVWAGVTLYLTYTFVLYCFDVHFNKMFPLYCLCLGLSFYGSAYFFGTIRQEPKKEFERSKWSRTTGIYFISIAVIFYFLWLAEIIPAITSGSTPKSLVETGLFTNGVQVLDLAIVLPGIFMVGVLLLQGKILGFLIAPVILTFFVLMDVTIGYLALAMKSKGLEGNLALAVIMGIFAMMSLLLLGWFFRGARKLAGG